MVKSHPQLASLTPRETEILELLGKGLTNAEISTIFGISPNTAKAHVANLLRKLGASNRTEAAGLLRANSPAAPIVTGSEAPAIAVMPFWRTGQVISERTQADGVVDDLITRLGRRWFPVIARCSSYAVVNEQVVDAQTTGQLLNARYLVEGDYRRSGARLHMNVRLIDAENGRVIWGDIFDRRVDDLFDVQFELSSAIVTSVMEHVIGHVALQSEEVPAPLLKPWELAVRGMSLFWEGTQRKNGQAREVFQQVLSRKPQLRLALYGLALSFQREVVEQWTGNIRASVVSLHQASNEFSEAHPNDAWAALVAAYASIYAGEHERAALKVSQAIALEPSSLRARSLRGQILAMAGNTAPAVEELKLALRISPQSPHRWSLECAIALAHFAAESYEESITWAQQASSAHGASAMPYGVLASCYSHLGDKKEANHAMRDLKVKSPKFSTDQFRTMLASTRPDIAERYLKGLEMAAE